MIAKVGAAASEIAFKYSSLMVGLLYVEASSPLRPR